MRYTIDSDEIGLAIEFGWSKSSSEIWVMTERASSVQWGPPFDLNEAGRAALLRHFELESVAHEYPVAILQGIHPDDLKRRAQALQLAAAEHELSKVTLGRIAQRRITGSGRSYM